MKCSLYLFGDFFLYNFREICKLQSANEKFMWQYFLVPEFYSNMAQSGAVCNGHVLIGA